MAKPRIVQEFDFSDFSTGEDFEALLNEVTQELPREGSVVKGTVAKIENDQAIIDIGCKTEGRVPIKEFPLSERDDVKEGDVIDVFLERIENSKGEAVISRERAVREEAWTRLEALHEQGETARGVIFSRIKGGFTVDLDGAMAFLPGSQVDVRPIKDITPLMGVAQPFQILKMDRKRGNIVVSRRAILEESRNAERDSALENIKEGMVLEGVVKNITDYGAFVDLGALDGLLHVTDISWSRISHPSEVISLGQTIEVKVIKFDEKNKRISLGLKQMQESPWRDAEILYAEGTRHKGRVTNVTDYGAFIELDNGVEGLVHVSEMSWSKKNLHPGKIVAVGDEVESVVLSINPEKRRLSLGLKQCTENPWEKFALEHQVGEVLEGEIKSVADFGIFVDVGSSADGLVHVSDLVWEGSGDEAIKTYNKGDKITVKVLEVDPERERISLGVKQLEGDGPQNPLSDVRRGNVVTVTVSAIEDGGVEVTLGKEGEIKSFIKRSDLSRDRVECRPERFSVGDRIDAKVTGMEKGGIGVRLSIKALELEEERKAIEEFGSADSGAKLGNILGVALNKAQEEAKEKADSEE